MTEKEKIQKRIDFYKRLVFVLVFIGFVVIVYGLYCIKFTNGIEHGVLGDFFGGTVAVLWSLAGIVLIYIAFLGQQLQLINQEEELKLNRDELKLNREELKETRKEIAGQKEQMEIQNETIKIQKFENVFFNGLGLRKQTIDNINGEVPTMGTLNGISIFRELKKALKYRYERIDSYNSTNDPLLICQNGKNLYQKQIIDDKQLISFNNHLKDYYRFFVYFLSSIEKFNLSNTDNLNYYVQLLMTQLSNEELFALFYMGTSDFGQAKGYTEVFNRLKIFRYNYSEIIIVPEHKNMYPHLEYL